MAKHKYGFGFCSYVAPGSEEPAEHDVGQKKLILLPKWRIRGFITALSTELVGHLFLMGTSHEVTVYRRKVIEGGVCPERVSGMVTAQTTMGNAKDVWRFLDENEILADEWALLTSDYHKERAVLTARKFHNLAVRHAYGTESIQLSEAMRQGGLPALHALREKMEQTIDPKEYLRRTLWELNGCAQAEVNIGTYTPDK